MTKKEREKEKERIVTKRKKNYILHKLMWTWPAQSWPAQCVCGCVYVNVGSAGDLLILRRRTQPRGASISPEILSLADRG